MGHVRIAASGPDILPASRVRGPGHGESIVRKLRGPLAGTMRSDVDDGIDEWRDAFSQAVFQDLSLRASGTRATR